MSSLLIAATASVLMLAGTALGIFLNRRLPDGHLTDSTKEIIKLSTGIIATIAGLVLSLLIATAKNSYDAVNSDVKAAAADFIMLDRTLAQMGDQAVSPRQKLRQALGAVSESNLNELAAGMTGSDPIGKAVRIFERLQTEIRTMTLTNPADEWLRQRALSITSDLSKARWMMQQEESDVLPTAFIGIVMLWLAIIFAGFGLFTPANPTAIGALIVGAVSISASLFLINELNTPFYGLVQISPKPLIRALSFIGPLN